MKAVKTLVTSLLLIVTVQLSAQPCQQPAQTACTQAPCQQAAPLAQAPCKPCAPACGRDCGVSAGALAAGVGVAAVFAIIGGLFADASSHSHIIHAH